MLPRRRGRRKEADPAPEYVEKKRRRRVVPDQRGSLELNTREQDESETDSAKPSCQCRRGG